jgi:hypothetical protein
VSWRCGIGRDPIATLPHGGVQRSIEDCEHLTMNANDSFRSTNLL